MTQILSSLVLWIPGKYVVLSILEMAMFVFVKVSSAVSVHIILLYLAGNVKKCFLHDNAYEFGTNTPQLLYTVLQPMMIAKLNQQRFWPCHDERLILTITKIPQCVRTPIVILSRVRFPILLYKEKCWQHSYRYYLY